jgi:type I restriction enzyme S subunit
MNAARLLKHYEQIADAPDAIARLRRFVLDLAVRGKLVPQDANDEPASELLKRIAEERARLVKAGEIRKPKATSPEYDGELAFAVPSGWVVARLDDLSPRSLSDGDWIETKDQSENGGVRLIQLADVGVGKFLNKSARYITEDTEIRLNCTRLAVGDVLIARLPNPIGRACIFPDIGQPAITAVDVAILRPNSCVLGQFLVLAMNAPPVREQIEAYGKGATRFRVSTGHLKTIKIPLPPLAEQERIVAKVDELMGLCDRLEAARADREAVRDRLAAASLARLSTPDPDTFQADARFVLDALPALTSRPDQIKALRQTILNLAVRGKLVPQDSNDEPASELLNGIRKTRKKLYAEKRIPKPKALPSIDELDLPFAIPSGWAWSLLGDLCYQVSDGPHFSPQYVSAEEGVPFLSARNIRLGSFDLSTVKHVSRADHEEFCKRIRPEKGDIIYTKGGTTGIAKVNDLDFEFSVWVHLAVLRIEKARLYPRYVELALNSPHCYAQSQHYTQGTSNFDLGLTRMIKITLPLPPLAEQHRIVAKVDALMALCDQLEASLSATAVTRRRLLDALLAEALAPADDRELEAAE